MPASDEKLSAAAGSCRQIRSPCHVVQKARSRAAISGSDLRTKSCAGCRRGTARQAPQPVVAQPVIGLGSMAGTAPAGVVTDHGTSPMRQPRTGQVLPVVLVAFIGKAMPCHAQTSPRCQHPQQPKLHEIAETVGAASLRAASAQLSCAAACPVPGPLPEAWYLAPHAKRAAAAALPSCVSSDFGPRQQSVGQGALSFPDGSAGRRRGGGSRHR